MAMATPVEESLIAARIRMLLNMPFYGNLAVRLKLIDASQWCPTAGTDGKHFYYNKEFVESLDKKELEFLFGHEVMHCVYDHMERRGSRDPQLWNCAADFVINLELVDSNVGKLIHHPGKIEPCYDEKYRNMTSDQVYELLKEESEKNGNKSKEHMFDMHMDPAAGDGSGDEDGDGDSTGATGPVPMSEDERSILKDEIQNAVREAAKVAGVGNCPGGVKRMMQDLNEPKMDWRELLNSDLQSFKKSDYTFSRPNRKSSGMGGGIILPGQNNDTTIDVLATIDTSGSISHDMIKDFMSEIKGIMDQFDDFTFKVFCWDTKSYTIHNYTPDNIEDVHNFEPEGGGGTYAGCIWDRINEEELKFDQIITFTDGWFGESEWYDHHGNIEPDACFWVIHDSWGHKDAPGDCGTVINYDT